MFDRELDCFFPAESPGALPVHAVRPEGCEALLAGLPTDQSAYARALSFTGAGGRLVLLPGETGIAGALLGLGTAPDPYVYGVLATGLPEGAWCLSAPGEDVADALLGFGLGAYRYTALKRQLPEPRARLVLPDHPCVQLVTSLVRAAWLARDLINTPPNLLGPAELAQAARLALTRRGGHVEVIVEEDLHAGFPAVHAVAQGSTRKPAIVSALWRSPSASPEAPLISICGKGVCFDTGGYDIKPSAAMLRMKKDMGGAAIALGLCCAIIEADLPIRLELRLGCVDNMISGGAMRPSDVIATRAGLSVEVGNTDAEGRLVLCDLLTAACESKPNLLLDFATLTGAARVALGPDIPAMFTNDDGAASLFVNASRFTHDPVWRLPLWNGYNSWLETGAGDLNNVAEKATAGAIVAALFLQRFVSAGTTWAHFDVYAWNDTERPGRPLGGEVQAMRAAFEGVARFAGRGAS